MRKKVHWALKMYGMFAVSLSHVLMSEQIFGLIAKEFGTHNGIFGVDISETLVLTEKVTFRLYLN